MKKTTSTFSLGVLFLFAASNLLAQEMVTFPSLVGTSLNKAEMIRIRIGKVIPMWKNNYPDSVIIKSIENGSLELLTFNEGDNEGKGFRLPEVKKEELFRLIRFATKRVQEDFEVVSNLLEENNKASIVAILQSGESFSIEAIIVSDGYIQGLHRGNEIRIGWWEFDEIRVPESLTGQGAYNPNRTRYLFAPSAIPLNKGEGYYQNVMVGVNSVNYGLTDQIAISGGLELFSSFASLFMSENFALGFVNVKTGFRATEKLYLGGGILAGEAFLQKGERGVIGYGLATYGTPNTNISLGAGIGNIRGNWKNDPVITINGMHMFNRKVGLVTENWINLERWAEPLLESSHYDFAGNYIPTREIGTEFRSSSTIVLTGGLRVFSNQVTFDLALVSGGNISRSSYEYTSTPFYGGERSKRKSTYWIPFPVPFLGLIYKFQK